MRLVRTDIYDALRAAGIAHEPALTLAEVLTPHSEPVIPSFPLRPVPAWPFVVALVMLGGCLLFAGYLICTHQHLDVQATQTRALIEKLQPLPHP